MVWFFSRPRLLYFPSWLSSAHNRAADDFEAIRARMEQLRRERAEAVRGEPIGSPRPSSPSRPGAAADPGFVDASMD
jgi:hypothetical protein